MRVLIDSSVVIDYLRTHESGKESLLTKIQEETDGVVFSLITLGEIYSGKSAGEKGKEKEIEAIFSTGQIVEIDLSLMKEASRIRRETGISLEDAVIAATAVSLSLSLATLNEKDFRKVKELKLYL